LRRQRNHDNRVQWQKLIRLENDGGTPASLLAIFAYLAQIDQPNLSAFGMAHT
jgi:hypothetical protein